MLKRLWLILGPVFCAMALVATLLFFYPINHKHNLTEEKKAAVSLTAEGFKSRARKEEALGDPNYRFVPFFGSSEWLRFDIVHPAVLAEKYDRSYRPYFLGQRGAASLNQYFGMQQILPQLEGKTAVYVVSPQWFTKDGYDSSAFQQYFNSDQLTSFLANQEARPASQYAASRLLQQYPNVAMQGGVQKLAKGQNLSSFEKGLNQTLMRFVRREDAFFSTFTAMNNSNYEKKVLSRLNDLPDTFSYEALEEVATAEAKKKTNNNKLGISNSFYNHRLASKLKKLKGFQKNESYEQSPEYNDLQLVLDQFAQSKTNVIFVIPPVNSKWMAYTGLSKEMYQRTVEKIRYQLESQGFTHIADFSKDGDKPYFMQDTIHMGWNGWLAFDKAVDPFVSNPQPAPEYKINNRFLSQDWANYKGQPDQFK